MLRALIMAVVALLVVTTCGFVHAQNAVVPPEGSDGDLEGPDYIQPPEHYWLLQRNQGPFKPNSGETIEGGPANAVSALTGTREILVILVELADVAPDPVHTTAYFWDRFFDTNPPSVRNYYSEVSYGNFTYVPGSVLGWYPSSYTVGQWDTVDSRPVVAEAIQDVDADFDFSTYDTNPADGTVTNKELTIFIIVSGDRGGAFHWWTTGPVATGDGVQVEGEFNTTHEWRHIGSYAHELGHDLGLPDLYDTDKNITGTSEGIGNYGLMGGGSWTFSHMTAWSRIQLGWVVPVFLSGCGLQQIHCLETNAEAYILHDPSHSFDEYFLIENRHPAEAYYETVGAPVAPSGTYPDDGLVIYHIDESKLLDWISTGANNVNVDETRKAVDVETAEHATSHAQDVDDLDACTNRGDGDDLWDSSEYDFYGSSAPCEAIWYDASDSRMLIGGFSVPGSVMTFRYIQDMSDDVTPPSITCPANITVSNDPGQCGAVVDFPAPVCDDNCQPLVDCSCGPASGSFFPVGTTTVTCRAEDQNGNSATCTFKVTVDDSEPPEAVCPADIVKANDPDECGAVVIFTATASDNCPGVSIVADPPSGSFFPVGITTVTCTATDAAGNKDECTFTVTVNDTQPPIVECPDNITVDAPVNQCETVVIWDLKKCWDNCPDVVCTCDPPSGSVFKTCMNAHQVTCTATDTAGNTSTCAFEVTVNPVFDVVYVDDDWAEDTCDVYLGTGRYGEDMIYGCNGFDNWYEAVAAIHASEMWVFPGTYDLSMPPPPYTCPLVIAKDSLEIYSTGGPEVTVVMGGCDGLRIEADGVTIGDVGRGFTFTGNINAIIVLSGAGTQIHHNHFCGNSESGVTSLGPAVDAELNWWGHCSGPNHFSRNHWALGDKVIGDNVDFDPWLFPCLVAWGDTCLDHELKGLPEEYLVGSDQPNNDFFAVGFYNAGGEALLTSVSFQFYDPGQIKLWVYLGPQGSCPGCESLGEGISPLGDSLSHIPASVFAGTWGWETVQIEGPCIQIPAKRCFYLVWQPNGPQGTPRIMGDAGHATTHSWIYNAQSGLWKCYPGYEYMVKACLNYQPDCVELHEADITWEHPDHGMYPCVGEDYTVTATFHNACDVGASRQVEFFYAPWGLFAVPPPISFPECSGEVTIPAKGSADIQCDCQYQHHGDVGNAWSRNITVRWRRDIEGCIPEIRYEDGAVALCGGRETWYTSRHCRMTIWPDSPWSKQPVKWGLSPIEIPVVNGEGRQMKYELFAEDMPAEWSYSLSWTEATLEAQEYRSVYLTVRPNGAEPTEPVVVRVRAFKCNGEWGEVEIEFMPYTKPFAHEQVVVDSVRWSPVYPCHDTPYDVWAYVRNRGTESAYPRISFGLAPWGFFQPVPEAAYFDTVMGGGIGGGDTKVVAPYHRDVPFFQYEDEQCTYYQGYYRNIVIDYPYYYEHCEAVEESTTAYYRDCRAWMWPKHSWPWSPVTIPIPVYNEEAYEDLVTLGPVVAYDGNEVELTDWALTLDNYQLVLEPGQLDTVWLSVTPGDARPVMPVRVDISAMKAFCQRESSSLSIHFMPFTGMCMPDYSGTIVEDPPGVDPSVAPGDNQEVSLMLQNDYAVSAAQIDVNFDPEYLEVVKVMTTTRTDGMQLTYALVGEGVLRILLDSTPVPHKLIDPSDPAYACQTGDAGHLSIATVVFYIKEMVPVGQCTDITYGTVALDGLPTWPEPRYPEGLQPKEPLCLKFADKGQICFGGFIWPVKCDVTQDSSVTLVDLFAILRHIVGQTLIAGAIDDPETPLWAADANGDQVINIIDLMKCINKAVGQEDPKVVAPRVDCRPAVALANRTVSIPVEVTSQAELAGLFLRFAYDERLLTAVQPVLTERAAVMELDWSVVDGQLMVLVSSRSGQVVASGSGVVVRVPFVVSGQVEADVVIEVVEPVVFVGDRVYVEAGVAVTVKVGDVVPSEYALEQNYPNPFNPTTSIQFAVGSGQSAAHVTLKVFNVMGQEVATLVDEAKEPGYYSVTWDASDMASGVYFCRITANEYTATRNMVLMK